MIYLFSMLSIIFYKRKSVKKPGLYRAFLFLRNRLKMIRLQWTFRSIHLLCCLCFFNLQAQQHLSTAILVIGGGTGGTAAAIQSARSGVKTILVEPTHMLGGMLTAAGVSCTDGNDALASGIWQSFREALHTHYGTKNLATGWVSETCFEPHVELW